MSPSAPAPADVSVVICAYDEARWSDLGSAVESVRNQTQPAGEVIVVIDNNPRLLERARAELAGVIVTENSHQRGLAGARNSGIAAASHTIVAFLDDDAVASPDWLRLLSFQYDDLDVAGVGGRADPTWATGRPGWFPPEFDWVVGCTYRGAPEDDVRNLIGCNMSFRRELLVRLGGFRVEPYGDETEICIRLRQWWPEKRLVYVPEARVDHRVAESRARLPYFLRRCYIEGRAKARISSLVGPTDGLATERGYVRSVLPRAARGGVLDFVTGKDRAGLARAWMIIAGLATTAAAYAITRAAGRGEDRRATASSP